MAQIYTNITTINGKLSLYFDQIEQLKSKYVDHEVFSSEFPNKCKHVIDEHFICGSANKPFPQNDALIT